MSRSWTPEELAQVSAKMKAAGHMSYEEFCEHLEKHPPTITPQVAPQEPHTAGIKIPGRKE